MALTDSVLLSLLLFFLLRTISTTTTTTCAASPTTTGQNPPVMTTTTTTTVGTTSEHKPPAVMCPVPCQCSKSGKSVNCEGKRLTSIPKGIPPLVQDLYLDHNNFVTLETGSLSGLVHLTRVYLRNSQIQTLARAAFSDLPLLSELYLTTNKIAAIHPNAFQKVDTLSLLNLQANKLTSIPDVSSLRGLKKLILEGNQIHNATFPAGFAALASLSSIVLSNNNITTVDNGTFKVLAACSVRRLELTRNGLRNVSAGTLAPLHALQSLKIGLNPLDGLQLQNVLRGLSQDLNLLSLDISSINLGGTLPSVSFKILTNTPLTTLIFNNNRVQKIPQRAFADLPKLLRLDLSNCHINKITDDAFTDLPQLQMLLLNNNNDLTEVPKNLPKSLLKLYLQYNGIAVLKGGDFKNLGNLRELYLSNNKMHQVSEDSFQGLKSLHILHLQNNLLSYIPKKLFTPLSNLATLILHNNNLQSLKLNPGALDTLAGLITLDMSDNQCSYIPLDYLKPLTNLQNLYLDKNRLSGLLSADSTGQLLFSMVKLRVLGLSNNNLQHIHDAQFRNLNSLQQLNLRNNHLSSWGPKLFHTPGTSTRTLQSVDLSNNEIALINETSVRDLQHVTTLNLSLNPFACTCDLLWFRQWINNTSVDIVNKTSYKCNSPPAWNGKYLMDFGPDKINCKDYLWYYIGGAIVATLIVACIICYLIFRHRWSIRFFWYRLRKSCKRNCCPNVEGRDGYAAIPGEDVAVVEGHDFYIIAAEEDNGWVVEKLLPTLDNGPTFQNQQVKYGGRFSLFFEERDVLTGTKISNFDAHMPSSRGVLIVLTKELKHCSWCKFLIEQAYHLQIEGTITTIQIILVGTVPTKSIPRRLQPAIERGDYRKWLDRENVEGEFVDHLTHALDNNQN